MQLLPNIRKIAVLRANALGDFVFALPALAALDTAYPNAEIVLLAKPWHKTLLSNRPGPIDRVIVIPPSKGVREDLAAGRQDTGVEENPEELEQFFNEIKKEQFDLAIQIHGGGRYSNPFTKKLDAKKTLGLKTPDAIALDINVPYIYYQNEILRYLEVVKQIGAVPKDLGPYLELADQDLQEAAKAFPINKPFIVIHPGAGDPRRRWDPQNFAKVGDALAEKGFHIIVIGTGPEKQIVSEVIQYMQHPAENFYERVSLNGLAGLLSKAALLISNDSGPLHLARAVSTPTVGIFWCGNVINAGTPSVTQHRQAISWMVTCPFCGIDCASVIFKPTSSPLQCNHLTSFVANVAVEEVLQYALELL